MVIVDLTLLGQSLHTHVDAILGLDFFAPQSFSIDYKRKRLVFGLSEHATHALKVEVGSNLNTPYWIVPITMDGDSVRLLVDTGADSLTVFAGRAIYLLNETSGIMALTLTGRQELKAARPSTLAFGEIQFRHRRVYIKPEPQGGLQKLDGLFGPKSLDLTVIAFDWEHQTLRWGTD